MELLSPSCVIRPHGRMSDQTKGGLWSAQKGFIEIKSFLMRLISINETELQELLRVGERERERREGDGDHRATATLICLFSAN